MSVNKFIKCTTSIVLVSFLFWAGPASAEYTLNLTRGVTPVSKDVYDLHMLILSIVTVIGIGVFSVLFWSVYHHRKSKGAVAAQFHHSTKAEIIWTIIPILILVSLAIPATKTLIKMEQTADADITIKVTGSQWKWKYDYLNEGISFFSTIDQGAYNASHKGEGNPKDFEHYLLDVDNPVIVPVKTKIRILTTAADVIHSWWVPALGWKRDAIPGFINDNWTYIEEPGTYRGQCAELCGKDHGFMPIVINAVSKAEYDAWVEEQKASAEKGICAAEVCTKEELISAGKEIYGTQCVACHQAEGQGIPGMFPALAGSAIANGPASDHINRVLNGKNIMPAFAGQLSDEQIAAVITFERNSWGNTAGDVIQPADVKAAR